MHIESYPTPNIVKQDLPALLKTVAFVNHIFFGRWNYNRRVSDYPGAAAFYREQAAIVRRFCEMHGIEYEVT